MCLGERARVRARSLSALLLYTTCATVYGQCFFSFDGDGDEDDDDDDCAVCSSCRDEMMRTRACAIYNYST